MAERNTRIRYNQIASVRPDDLDSTNVLGSAMDNYVPSYDLATGKFTWVESGGGSIGADDVDGFTIQYENSKIKLDDRIEANIMLNAFRIAINGSLSQFGMVDGIVDEFEDESGIDTDSSTNESYDSTNDYYSPTENEDVKLLLNCDGSDGSTTFDDVSSSNHSITANGTAQVDTSNKKFGTGSLQLDGDSDYLSSPDSNDWDICGSASDDWTIDLWVKHNNHDGDECYVSHWESGDEQWRLYHTHGIGVRFYMDTGGGSAEISFGGGEITDTDWHHVAIIKVEDDWAIYLDGTRTASTTDNSTATFSGSLYIGAIGNPAFFMDGYLDDIRIYKGNPFNADPTSSSSITVPTSAHTVGTPDLTLISESFTAETTPENARIVIFEEDVDSITINTDFKAYISRDGGSTWAEVTLSDSGDYDTNKRVLVGTVDLTASGIGSGTNIEYKLTTDNGKNLKIHGVGLLWD